MKKFYILGLLRALSNLGALWSCRKNKEYSGFSSFLFFSFSPHPTPTPQGFLILFETGTLWGMEDFTEWCLPVFTLVGAKLVQSCPTLYDSVDCSPPGFSVRGILQARILEWVAISFSTKLPKQGKYDIRVGKKVISKKSEALEYFSECKYETIGLECSHRMMQKKETLSSMCYNNKLVVCIGGFTNNGVSQRPSWRKD